MTPITISSLSREDRKRIYGGGQMMNNLEGGRVIRSKLRHRAAAFGVFAHTKHTNLSP